MNDVTILREKTQPTDSTDSTDNGVPATRPARAKKTEPSDLTRRDEMLLWDIESQAKELYQATRQIKSNIDRFESQLLQGFTGMTPDVRDVETINKLEAELKLMVKFAKQSQIDGELIEMHISTGIGAGRIS